MLSAYRRFMLGTTMLRDSTGGDGAAAAATGDGGAAAAAASAAAAKPWYDGKADAETIGTWQNKGWNATDPATVALEATKAYREAQKFIGVPADQILRLPKDANDEAGWNSVYQRLGAPADAKDYDFSSVKDAAGNAPDAKLLDAIRATAASLRVPKDKAPDLAAAVVKHLDGVKAEQAADAAAKLQAEKAELAKSWGTNAEMNRLQAMQGAKRLGVDPETVAQLENQIGYSKVMEMFRKIGVASGEDTFVEGGKSGSPATQEGAHARKAELMADQAWAKRYLAGDAAAKREMDALNQLITGVAA